MPRFLILHHGFEPPTPEQMEGWNAWFASVEDRKLDQAGLGDAREIDASGVTEQPFGRDSLTGYTLIEAKDLDEATAIAGRCPIVAQTRVHAVRG